MSTRYIVSVSDADNHFINVMQRLVEESNDYFVKSMQVAFNGHLECATWDNHDEEITFKCAHDFDTRAVSDALHQVYETCNA